VFGEINHSHIPHHLQPHLPCGHLVQTTMEVSGVGHQVMDLQVGPTASDHHPFQITITMLAKLEVETIGIEEIPKPL